MIAKRSKNPDAGAFIKNTLIGLLDPITLVSKKHKRAIQQTEFKYLQVVAFMHYVGWIAIWTAAAIFNDSNKPNPEEWLKYRITAISTMSLLAVITYFFRKKSSNIRLSMLLLAAVQVYFYSWSMGLGVEVPAKWIVYFPTVILITSFRSVALNALVLVFFLWSSHPFWSGYATPAWLYTDAEISFVIMLFSNLVWRVALTSINNQMENERLRVEVEKQKAVYIEQMLRFVSPALVQRIRDRINGGMSTIAAIDTVLHKKSKQVAVIYSDMRNFSRRSNSQDFIDNELIPSTSLILDHCESQGGIGKQIADAVIIYYDRNDPEESLLFALRDAFICAVNEQNRCREQSKNTVERYFILSFGTATVGNMASSMHREPTIIGDAPNIAARIDDVTKNPYVSNKVRSGDKLLINEYTANYLLKFSDNFEMEQVDFSKINYKLRTYENETCIYLMVISKSNLEIISKLLEINGFNPIQESVFNDLNQNLNNIIRLAA